MAEEKETGGVKKKVDERWKEETEREKRAVFSAKDSVTGAPEGREKIKPGSVPQADFSQFVAGLGIQAAIFLGEVENPVTGKKEKNLDEAKYIIDTMEILKEKTEGNLTEAETGTLDNLLYELRLRYVRAAG